MPYSTPTDVRNALNKGGQGPDNEFNPVTGEGDLVTGSNLSDAQILDQIVEADATINNYIGRFYATPVDTVAHPEPVRSWSRDIAAYLATLAYRMSKDFTDQDPVPRRYAHAMEQLRLVLEGKMKLQDLPEVEPEEAGGSVYVANQYEGDAFAPSDFSIGPGPMPPNWQNGRWPHYGYRGFY